MTNTDKLQTLRDHQAWRLGADSAPPLPRDITEAIDYAIQCVETVQMIEAELVHTESAEAWFLTTSQIRALMVPK